MTVRPEWLQASDSYGWRAVARNIVPFLALLWLAPRLRVLGWLAPWLLAPLIGLFIYRITIVMHDCVHRTLFHGARLNQTVGVALGAMTGIDLRSFAREHWRHHEVYGQPDDPQGFHYVGVGSMSPGRFTWHIVKPLLGLNFRQTFAESFLAPRNLAAASRSGHIWILLAAQAFVIALVTGGGLHLELALLPAASGATFGLFFSQLRGIAEHVATGSEAEQGRVRSHAPEWFGRTFLYDLHFNYHEEHHRYPQCPSVHLPAIHRDLFATRAPPPASMLGTLRGIPRTLAGRHA